MINDLSSLPSASQEETFNAMVNVPGRSNACHTCKARKIKVSLIELAWPVSPTKDEESSAAPKDRNAHNA